MNITTKEGLIVYWHYLMLSMPKNTPLPNKKTAVGEEGGNEGLGGYIVFNSIGTAEKDLMATAVVARLKKAYPLRGIIVMSNNPEIWLHNPDVYRVYKLGATPYFYEDYILGKDTWVYWQDPYNTSEYILGLTKDKPRHLIDIWSELCGLSISLRDASSGDEYTPRLFFTYREVEATTRMMGLENDTRPLFFLQTRSGILPDGAYAWNRDMPALLAAKIVEQAIKKGFRVMHLRAPNETPLRDTEWLNFNTRQMLCALSLAKSGFFIQSYAQHAAAAFNIPMSVLWIVDKPERVGYVSAHYPHVYNVLPLTNDPAFTEYCDAFSELFVGINADALRNCPFAIERYFGIDEVLRKIT